MKWATLFPPEVAAYAGADGSWFNYRVGDAAVLLCNLRPEVYAYRSSAGFPAGLFVHWISGFVREEHAFWIAQSNS
jgi:hypothetical protein